MFRSQTGSRPDFGTREDHPLLFQVLDQAIDEHEADEGLAEAHAIVAQEGPSVLAGDPQQRLVAIALILVQDREELRLRAVPIRWR